MGSDTSKARTDSENMASTTSFTSIRFHEIHGSNILLNKRETIAYRPQGFNNGIVFTSRPVMVLEPISIKINETATNWSGALRVGFTIHNPKTFKSNVPSHTCPELVSVYGNWAKALPEHINRKDSVLTFHVEKNGAVYYAVNGEEKRFLVSGVDTSRKVWGVIDVYGNTVKIELIGRDSSESEDKDLPNFNLAFHKVHGKTAILPKNRTVAARKPGLTFYPYVFSDRPIKINEKIIIQVLGLDQLHSGPLEYGITSCDPSTLPPETLPAETEDLLDWPDYWVLKQDPCHYDPKDIILFSVNAEGKFMVMKNGDCVSAVFHVDTSQPLWLFVKLSGSVTNICMIGSTTKDYADIMKQCEQLSFPSKKRNEAVSAASSESIVSELIIMQDYEEVMKLSQQISTCLPLEKENKTAAATSKDSATSECVICCEKSVDCALYRCGHMCMCYECAQTLWHPNAKVQCPICREAIEDVLKVYT